MFTMDQLADELNEIDIEKEKLTTCLQGFDFC